MTRRSEVERALIRGLGYRVARGFPWWLALLVLVLVWLLGGEVR